MDMQTIIQSASKELQIAGEVPTWHRQAIYAVFGPSNTRQAIPIEDLNPGRRARFATDEAYRGGMPYYRFREVFGAQRTLGHIRRSWLAVLTFDALASVWDQHWMPGGRRKYEDYQILSSFLREVATIGRRDVEPLAGRWVLREDAADIPDLITSVAAQAYELLTTDHEFVLDPLPAPLPNTALSDFQWDVPYFTAYIVGMGASQQTFWHWWLHDAVPAVLRKYPDGWEG